MTKYYLEYNTKEPIHPKDVYGESYESGLSWHGQINPPNISLNNWRKKQDKKYKALLETFKKDGKVKSLKQLIHPTKETMEDIEKDINFIEWIS